MRVRLDSAVQEGEWVALGLKSGRSPVGIVEKRSPEQIVINLVSAFTGYPMDQFETVSVDDVEAWTVAPFPDDWEDRHHRLVDINVNGLWAFQAVWHELMEYRTQGGQR